VLLVLKMIGHKIYKLAKVLWPINRSITGDGVRISLKKIQKIIPNLKIIENPSGKKVFDWKIPEEWNVSEAWLKGPNGRKIADFSKNNLSLVGYSVPIKSSFNLNKIKKHIHTIKTQPNATPYVTSYYKRTWGFCIPYKSFKKLKKGKYEVCINSEIKNGHLTYGEIIIPGKRKQEIFISTNICHPSMANNEISGPVVTTYLAKWIQSIKNRKYTYRIIFVPETIGSITYLSKKYKYLKKNVIAGFNVVCVGDNRCYSYLPSRNGNTLSDKVLKHVLKKNIKKYKIYSWANRGSDERQYCSPGIDLPIATVMRSKYGTYPEYHTSLDNLKNVVSPAGLNGGYRILKLAIETLEKTNFYQTKFLGEPHLSKRNLYPTTSIKNNISKEIKKIMDIISYSDGKIPTIEIADRLSISMPNLNRILNKLEKKSIIKKLL
jgi:aminopeptidase-like protein